MKRLIKINVKGNELHTKTRHSATFRRVKYNDIDMGVIV